MGNQRDNYVIVAVITTPNVHNLRRIANETRLNVRPRLSRGHILHAATDSPNVTADYLLRLAGLRELNMGIVALDKTNIWRYTPPNSVYNMLMSYAITRTLEHSSAHPERVLVVIESRYTRPQRIHLQSAIAEYAGVSRSQINQVRKDSQVWRDAISSADTVAWAWRQKLEYGRNHFASLLTHQIAWEEIVGIDHEIVLRPVSAMIEEQ